MAEVNFKKIEEKWQKAWEKKKIFEVKDGKKKKFYCLEMFPYPSGTGLHMGHAFNYTIGDIQARFRRMHGLNVLYPMGYDAFGLPAENAAIKAGEHPAKYTKNSMKNFMMQQKALGLSYDWTKLVVTCEPEYYKWNQYFFLKFLEKGLVYRKKAAANWCSKCNTVLANEQVHSGKCWRHEDTDVEIKHLEQWFIRTTRYSEELLKEIPNLKWPEKIKLMQENWIGKSEGTEIDFDINGKFWKIFTTRPDTIFGVTFMVVSAQHPSLMDLVTREQKAEVEKFLKKIKTVSEKDTDLGKEGAFTGSYAINPLTKEKIPVWVGNFVVADYGSGMVMAVPAHDQRDWEFAVKYKIPIKQVIAPLFVTTTGKEAVKKDKESIQRDSVLVIVKHWKEDKYLCLDWKKYGWRSFVVGGIEKGESAEKAAIRETREETGYQDIKSVKAFGFENHGNFYAEHKGINRYARFKPFLVQLGSDKHKLPDKECQGNHEAVWIDREKVASFINMPNPKYLWEIYIKGERAFTESGVLVNSGKFSSLDSEKAKEEITRELVTKKLGRKTVNYKFRDWLVSRQRYWGTPIPIIYCPKCGAVPVPEKDLPVKLPGNVKFGKGNPLETNKEFINVKCPKCSSSNARRETDTMDTFFDSSWYFLRYCDNKNKKEAFDKKKMEYWMPVDQYIGGAEHACMHLIYARFFTKALRDMGYLKFDEPFIKLFNQGMLHGADGFVMSKSRGNVVLPEEVSERYGIDTARLFLMSQASPDKDTQWNENGIEGSFRFLNKVMNFKEFGKSNRLVESKLNKTVKEVSSDIEEFRYNLAIIKIRALFDYFDQVSKKDFETFLKLLAPFCPHITEELWHKLGNKNFISLAEWPIADEKKINPELEKNEQSKDKLISDIQNILKILEARGEKNKKIIKIFAIPNEVSVYEKDRKRIEDTFDMKVEILNIKDASKTGKTIKAMPGKPGILIE